jgi:hypothetical protein
MNLGLIATFVLDPSRRPHAPNGRFASFPFIDLFGTIGGWTGLHYWMWAADDKWCKCFLHLRQTAFQLIPGAVIVLAEKNDHKTLIDEENNARSVNHGLPGFQPMPDIQFSLSDPNLPVLVDLKIRFDIQLEVIH